MSIYLERRNENKEIMCNCTANDRETSLEAAVLSM